MIPGGTDTERKVNALAKRLGVDITPAQVAALAALMDARRGTPVRLVAKRGRRSA